MSHAILNPSSSARWLTCLGSVPLIAALPVTEDAGEFADEGTAAHELGSRSLSNGKLCQAYMGETIHVRNEDGSVRRSFKVDDDMASYTQVYVDSINDKMHEGATLLVEQRVASGVTSMLYGPVDGTADAIIIMPQFKMIDVNDLKYGRGVRVDAPGNTQLRLYGLGALRLVMQLGDMLGLGQIDADWKVRMCIYQPRLDHYSDEVLTVRELLAWGESVQEIVNRIDAGEAILTPTDKACQWCPLKATCPKLAEFTLNAVLDEFKDIADLTDFGLAAALEKVELIEQWVKSVRAEAYKLLDAGQPIPGWKLVAGRQGNREWTDAEMVEAIFKNTYRFNREEMYDSKLISPTAAEKKLAKANPKRWEDLQKYIQRKPGNKTLARDTDTRPATSVLDHFKV